MDSSIKTFQTMKNIYRLLRFEVSIGNYSLNRLVRDSRPSNLILIFSRFQPWQAYPSYNRPISASEFL